jgi:hypothetical protein
MLLYRFATLPRSRAAVAGIVMAGLRPCKARRAEPAGAGEPISGNASVEKANLSIQFFSTRSFLLGLEPIWDLVPGPLTRQSSLNPFVVTQPLWSALWPRAEPTRMEASSEWVHRKEFRSFGFVSDLAPGRFLLPFLREL